MGRNLCSEDTQLVGQAQKYVADMYVHVTVSRSAAHHKLDRDAQKAASLCRLDVSTARKKQKPESSLLSTTSMYSSSVGHWSESRHKSSSP